MNLYHLKEKAIQLATQLESVQTELSDVLHQLQGNCHHPHENVIEAPFESGTSAFFFHEEMRFCTLCGLQELRGCGGWRWIINKTGEYGDGTPFRQVTRDQIYQTRYEILRNTSVGIDNEDKPTLEG
jgi:hypothetical protein